MPVHRNPFTSLQGSRRNLMRMGAIAASALIAGATIAAADDDSHRDRDRDRDWNGGGHKDKNRDRGLHDTHCFLAGTTIRTAEGGRKIEDLVAGDVLPTVFGGLRPIQWIGRYWYRKSDPAKAWVRSVLPIRIACSQCSSYRFVSLGMACGADRWRAGIGG